MLTLRWSLALLALSLLALFLLDGSTPAQPEADSSASFADAVQARRAARGLVGDGVRDETAALQRWIDAGQGGLTLPPGTYRLTRPLVVDLSRNGPVSVTGDGTARLIMDGPGPVLRFQGTHRGTAAPATVQPAVWERERAPMVSGLEIVGRHPEARGIEADGTMQLTLSRLVIRKVLHAIHLRGRNRNVIISECHLYENDGVGLLLEDLNLHQVNVTNCHISYNRQGGIVVRGSEIRNLQIGSCDIEGNMPDADAAPGTANILIDARTGSVREAAIVGCTIQHAHTAPDSANIRLLGNPEIPLKVGHFTIADNVLSDVAVNVELRAARGVTLTGNTMWKGFAHNVLAENCSHLVVANNLFDRNPDYRPADSANRLEFRNCSDSTLSGLHVAHTLAPRPGLRLKGCRWMNVVGGTFLDCGAAAVELADCENCVLSDCLIRGRPDPAPAALIVSGGAQNVLRDNMVAGGSQIDAASVSAQIDADAAGEGDGVSR